MKVILKLKSEVADTSLKAYYEKLMPILGKRQLQVFTVFLNNPNEAFTNMETAQKLGWSINRVTPRVLELRQIKLLTLYERRNCKVTGNESMAFKLSRNIEGDIIYFRNYAVLTKYLPKDEWAHLNDTLRERGYSYQGQGTWKRR